MPQSVKIIFGLFGGLAIFIFGMNMMSECLQKAAGERMKKILSLLTGNPILGVLVGALTTAVLQSSSATTVMTIGFVSAGLMNLPQAISIILGANIGTTMTAQIIAFKISNYIYAFIFIGFVISFVTKNQKWKNIGQTIFAFGLLFLGIETMGGVMKPLATSHVFTSLIAKVSNIPVLGVLLGTTMTLVVQSSSATIAVLQNFASQPAADGISSAIGLTGAIPILLGDNIGTTVTALLASIGQSKDAKRAAFAHSLFNISGCLIFIWFIPLYAHFIQFISPKGNEVEVISRQIANAHTCFNVAMTLVWIPLIWLMVKIVTKLVPDSNGKDRNPSEPRYLDLMLVGQPVAAVSLVTKEVVRCGEIVRQMLVDVKGSADKNDGLLMQVITNRSETVHSLNTKINDYMAKIFSSGSMNEQQATEASGILYVMSDIDRINLLCREVTENITAHLPEESKNGKKKENDLTYSEEAVQEIKASIKVIKNGFSDVIRSIESGDKTGARKILEDSSLLTDLSTKLRREHLSRVFNGKCSTKHIESYNALLNDIDRMGNSVVNLAENVSK